MKSALITGVTGQDGSYLSELLLEKGYKVYGLRRRTSSNGFGNVAHLVGERDFEIVEGDVTDLSSLVSVLKTIQPDELYNLAAQSEVGTSFRQPLYTLEATGAGVLNCLEAIRQTGLDKKTKFYQASTSEMLGGLSKGKPYDESSFFHPRSPYGVAKVYGHYLTINYREAYGMFACAGILFNHESARRGPYFVTQKIATAAVNIALGKQDFLYLGNLEAKRDWSHAKDCVRAMWLMLQQETPEEFIISSERCYSVRDFCKAAFDCVGLDYEKYVKVDPTFYRPAEVDVLIGNSSKAHEKLGWHPEISFEEMVGEMVEKAKNK